MYLLKQLFSKVNFYSLEFRLTFGIIIIFTLGLGGFTLIASNKIIILNTSAPHLNLQRLVPLSLLYNVIMIVVVSMFIRRSLLPLRELEKKVITQEEYSRKKMPTEVRAIATKWNSLLTKITEQKQQQQEFINNLSHELRTPLTTVYGYLQRSLRLNTNNLTDSHREALKMAVEEAERMVEILKDLLALARVQNGVMISLMLNDLVTEVVEMSEKFKDRPFELKLPSHPVTVNADSKQLMEVLNELLDNACKYSEVNSSVTVEVTQLQRWGIIEVRDRGCGIPEASQSRIFEAFYRVDLSRSRTTGGSGLGLSLVKKSVENMGGRVEVKSNLGEGSTFRVMLPTSGVKP